MLWLWLWIWMRKPCMMRVMLRICIKDIEVGKCLWASAMMACYACRPSAGRCQPDSPGLTKSPRGKKSPEKRYPPSSSFPLNFPLPEDLCFCPRSFWRRKMEGTFGKKKAKARPRGAVTVRVRVPPIQWSQSCTYRPAAWATFRESITWNTYANDFVKFGCAWFLSQRDSFYITKMRQFLNANAPTTNQLRGCETVLNGIFIFQRPGSWLGYHPTAQSPRRFCSLFLFTFQIYFLSTSIENIMKSGVKIFESNWFPPIFFRDS